MRITKPPPNVRTNTTKEKAAFGFPKAAIMNGLPLRQPSTLGGGPIGD